MIGLDSLKLNPVQKAAFSLIQQDLRYIYTVIKYINPQESKRVRTKFWTTIGLRKEPFYVFKRTKGYCTTDIIKQSL